MAQRYPRFMPSIAFVCLLFLASSVTIFAQESAPDTSPDAPPWEQVAPQSYWLNQSAPPAGISAYQVREALKAAISDLGPQPVEKWSRVVFQAATADGGWDIFSARVDGTELRRLTSNPASDITPRLNPQQTEVVFTSYRDGNAEVYKVVADGSAPPQRLTNNPAADAWPNWSPGGGGIVFASSRDRQFDLYSMGADGSNPTRLQHDPYSHDILPFYGPDDGVYYVRYTQDGAAIYKMHTPSQQMTPVMKDIDDPWVLNSSLIFSGDLDKDGAYELIWCEQANCGPNISPARPAKVLLDAQDPNVDVLAGPPAPWTPGPFGGMTRLFKIMYLRLRSHKENDQTIIDDISVNTGELTDVSSNPLVPDWQLQNTVNLPALSWTLPGAWILDDSWGPVLSIGAIPGYNFVQYNTTVHDDVVEVPMDGYDPGGSGIVKVMTEIEGEGYMNSVNWEDIQDSKILLRASSSNPPEIRVRLQGQDWNGNIGPWTDWATLKLYWGYVYGQTEDAYGRPIPEPRIVSPPPLAWPESTTGDVNGRFAMRVYQNGPMELAHEGYGAGRTFIIDEIYTNTLEGQTPTAIHLPPKEAIFQNGEFTTSSLDDWTVLGSASVVTAGVGYGNDTFLTLGSPNGYPAVLNGVTRLEKAVDLGPLHRPVLGFAYTGSFSIGRLEVNLEAGGVITPLLQFQSAGETLRDEMILSKGLYQSPSGLGISDVFFDLTPWTTSVVTLSLNLHDDGGYIRGQVNFDRISLGSWTTPVLNSLHISPTLPITSSRGLAAPAPITRTLIITGDNFLPGVTVKVGSRTLKQVDRQGETRLEAVLPADLPPGMHDLWVVNADKSAAVRPSAVPVGKQIYAPIVSK